MNLFLARRISRRNRTARRRRRRRRKVYSRGRKRRRAGFIRIDGSCRVTEGARS